MYVAHCVLLLLISGALGAQFPGLHVCRHGDPHQNPGAHGVMIHLQCGGLPGIPCPTGFDCVGPGIEADRFGICCPSAPTTTEEPTTVEPTVVCTPKADFVFVMDSSVSIIFRRRPMSRNLQSEIIPDIEEVAPQNATVLEFRSNARTTDPINYRHMKDFFNATVDALANKGPIGGDGFRIGFVLFSWDVKIVFDLNEFDNAQKLKEKIDAMPFMGSTTSMTKALTVTRELLNSSRPGDDRPTIVILLTDGKSTDGNPTEEANKLKGDGASIITVGVTDYINEAVLKAISTRGSFIKVDDFADLIKLVDDIIKTICGVATAF